MARPGAEILLSRQLDDFTGIEVLDAEGLYAVLYKDLPFNLKTESWTERGQLKKYVRTTYPNKKPAENLAAKLNKDFFTTEFSVVKIL
ncbi:hypothetical protein UFOVP281_15 [uncultured Caudovirales phage]|uniref:Uncharacterized protein n=1 Tax=uncultured Caudovirales phage TaxID=2100421 RepID=A0A6J5LJY0_9CAUD|nr:hypothetical protein UFOVP281_15 [uncultured Caudovirales phage]